MVQLKSFFMSSARWRIEQNHCLVMSFFTNVTYISHFTLVSMSICFTPVSLVHDFYSLCSVSYFFPHVSSFILLQYCFTLISAIFTTEPLTCTTSLTSVLSVLILARCSPLMHSPIQVIKVNLARLLMASPVVIRMKPNRRESSEGRWLKTLCKTECTEWRCIRVETHTPSHSRSFAWLDTAVVTLD